MPDASPLIPLNDFFQLSILPPAAVATGDIAVVIVYLLVTVGIGLWVGRGQKNLSDYLLGDRNLPWWAVLGSIVATETSTATVLSVPGWAFAANGDLRGLQLTFGYIVGRIIVAFFLLPQYFRGELFTAYDVLHRRFGGGTKTTASVLFLGTRTIGDGLRLYLAALVLWKFAGMSLPWAIVVLGVVTIGYTVFGGMRSVVWNDCIQFVVYIVGGLAALVLILSRLPGGFEGFLEFGRETGRFRVFDPSFRPADPSFWGDQFTFWCGLVGGTFLSLGSHGTDQLTVQRLLSARSQSDAAKALIVSGFVVFAQFALFLMIGVGLAAYFQAFPPQTEVQRPDGAFATFIVTAMPVGLCGLMLAAVFAAAMSTLSSSLNSSAASAMNDLILPRLRNQPSALSTLTYTRGLTVLFGFAQIAVAILGRDATDSVVSDVLAIAAFTFGILLGVFALGVLTTRVSQPAALAGLLGGVLVTGGVKVLTMTTAFALAGPWYALVGSVSTFVIGYLVSFIVPPERALDSPKP